MKRLIAGMVLTVGTLSSAHAEFLGLLTGRSANPDDMSRISLDIGIVDESDFRNIAVRGNFRVSDTVTAFAHIGQAEVDSRFVDIDGLSFGGGAYVYLPDQRIVPTLDIAAKGSVAFSQLEASGGGDLDYFSVTAEAVISGKEPLTGNGLSWYATGGVAYLDFDFDDDVEPTLGAGITLPLGPGTLFTGAELVDEVFLGVGYRFNL